MSAEDNSERSQDKELADLLDSALEDFSGVSSKEKVATTEQKKESNVDSVPEEWSADFVQQATMQFEETFLNLLSTGESNAQGNTDLIQEKLKEMANAAQQVLTNPGEVSDQSVDFASSISQAIADLNQDQGNLKAPFNEDDLLKMFGGSSSRQEGDILPFMEGMMQGLLSKEVLGPSLQVFVDQLPEYLEKNKDSLSKEDIERYQKQKESMEQILEELNSESDTDSKEVKKKRFSKVLALMQKLQDYGQPPPELVGNLDMPFSFDSAGNPKGVNNVEGASANQECCIM
ncbi:peroxisomal biogenesis factor 19 [Sitophilus oryzae]|uniref:Peroxin-19 n=1 Tax=Sitophilus oryzae TaxID=7048 RepID=A0A6J2YGU3_SITOR|nr:peroxisomal biogenesis factor 19 [Sitophilus oryzae]